MDFQPGTCVHVAQTISSSLSQLRLSVIFIAALYTCASLFASHLPVADGAQTYTRRSYLKPLDVSVEDQSFDSLFRYTKVDAIEEYENFDSEKLMELLIQSATNSSTPPLAFHKEIQELILFDQESKNAFTSKRREDLERKYNIMNKPVVMDPEMITYRRLSLMFPQYHDFQKDTPTHNEKYFGYNNNNGVGYNGILCDVLQDLVPKIMQHLEFGGLIPQQGKELSEDTRESIIRVHLYSLICDEMTTSFHERMTLLEKRMEKSLLSNEHRILLLQKSNILLKDKQINRAFLNIFNVISS